MQKYLYANIITVVFIVIPFWTTGIPLCFYCVAICLNIICYLFKKKLSFTLFCTSLKWCTRKISFNVKHTVSLSINFSFICLNPANPQGEKFGYINFIVIFWTCPCCLIFFCWILAFLVQFHSKKCGCDHYYWLQNRSNHEYRRKVDSTSVGEQ